MAISLRLAQLLGRTLREQAALPARQADAIQAVLKDALAAFDALMRGLPALRRLTVTFHGLSRRLHFAVMF